MLADAFVKAHAEAIKVETRKSDLFKVKQRDNEMFREFVSRFQMERMDLPLVVNDCAVQAFTQRLNPQSSLASQQLKQNLIEYPANYDRPKRVVNHEPRPNRNQYQPYSGDRKGSGSGRNPTRNEKRSDRGHNSQGLMSKNGFDRQIGAREAPRLSEYNFRVDAACIVSAIIHIKDTKWPQTLQSDPTQRNPNLMYKYHGTHGHRTEGCRQLREEVAREFLSDRAKNHFRNRDSNK
uniref:Retrotransposon gag domain-containing protein n=1 Tax=Nicotiana tabacum TaxID=4097 RepID=A0A1S4DDG0_TOBAC|nr:PREDICTED: uncharacterized protein LOC107828599 [Nicotiana tabacum]